MDVVRVNMSHTAAEQAMEIASRVRRCEAEVGRPIALLVDLQGPKIRLGRMSQPVVLNVGDAVVLAPEAEAGAEELPVTYAPLADDVGVGDRLLLADGQIELRVRGSRPPCVDAEVVVGGTVTSGKGINLPGVNVSAPALTEKDLADLKLAEEVGADYVALSFVRSEENVRALRRSVSEDVLVMSKIEKELALRNLERVLSASDAVMVARGDLGTELPFEQVPLAQKRIVRLANSSYRPVVVATEMLESMIERPRPTRAEVSDVANAILDGTDAVMLSAETAVGKYPVQSVRALARVIGEIEATSVALAGGPPYDVPATARGEDPVTTEVATACAAVEAIRAISAPAVVTFTRSGYTARVISSRRPPVPILAVTDSERVRRQLALIWGVVPVLCPGGPTYDEMWETGRSALTAIGLAAAGDRVVVMAGMPFHVRGTTNMVRIEAL